MSTTPSRSTRTSVDQPPQPPPTPGEDRDWQQKLESLRREDELLQGQSAIARDESEKARLLAEQTRETALKARKEALAQLAHEHELRVRAEQSRDLAKQELDQAVKQVQWQKNLRSLAETALKQVEAERDTARKDRQQANLEKKAAYEAKEIVLKQLQTEESARYKLSLENEELKKALAKLNTELQSDRIVLGERDNALNRLRQQFGQTQQVLKDTELQRQQLLVSTQSLQKELSDLKNSLKTEIQRRNKVEIELQDEKRKAYSLNEQLMIELESEKARRTKAELEVQECMNELQKVEGSRLVVEHGRHELVRKLETESSARHQLEQDRVDLNNKLRQQTDKLRLLEQACSQLHDEVQANKENSNVSKETLQQAHSQIESLKKELQQISQHSQQLQNEKQQLSQMINDVQQQMSNLNNSNKHLSDNCSSLQFELDEMSKQRDQASKRSVELLQALLSERASRQLLQESLQDEENLTLNEIHAKNLHRALREAVAPSDMKLLNALQNILKDALNAQNAITNIMSEQNLIVNGLKISDADKQNANALAELSQKAASTTNQSSWNIQRAQEITDALIKAQPSRPVSRLSARPEGGDVVGASASPSVRLRSTLNNDLDDDDDKSSHYSSAKEGRASSIDTYGSAASNFTSSYQAQVHGLGGIGGLKLGRGGGKGDVQDGDWSSPFDDPDENGGQSQVPPLPIGDAQISEQQMGVQVPLLSSDGLAHPMDQDGTNSQQVQGTSYMPPIQYGSESHLEALMNQNKENMSGGGGQSQSIPRSYNEQQVSGKGSGASRN